MERLQIAHTLHEGLLQELIGLKFGLDQSLEGTDLEQVQAGLQGIQSALGQQIRQLRDYCYELRPPALAPFGLEKAIRSHAEDQRTRHPELKIHLDLRSDYQTLSESLRLVLYRVYQEVMSNVLRHSKASAVSIRFRFDEQQATLEIEDNGLGFAVPTHWVEAARRGRLGLIAAQERVESAGGELSIVSTAGKGTRVVVRVPLNASPNGQD
jgi:signal transduction histidine kinase